MAYCAKMTSKLQICKYRYRLKSAILFYTFLIIYNFYNSFEKNRWQIRESCNPMIKDVGYTYKYDVSVPVSDFYNIATEIKNRLSATEYDHALTVVWGHFIDGNVHLNIVLPGKFDVDMYFSEWLESTIYDSVQKMKGSISAEHGLGQSKRKYLAKVKDKVALDLMYKIKQMLDPNGIMNPGKYLPDR